MADILLIAQSSQLGGRIVGAAQSIRGGFATLNELDGIRDNAIGDSQATMQVLFGTASTQDAQTLSDRWGALLYNAYNEGSTHYAAYAYLRDFIDAIALNTP